MLGSGGIIKKAMSARGFKHRRAEDQFSIQGEYARNLQYVYSKEYRTREGVVVDLLYFAVDILAEKLVIGFYRENPAIENGVFANSSRSIDLLKFSEDVLEKEIKKMITPVRDQFK